MWKGAKVTVVMPAYNASLTLKRVINKIPNFVDETVVVDDCSDDNTFNIAKELGVKLIKHPRNMGYGAAQKSGYREALKGDAQIIVLLHPDGQHDPREVPKFLEALSSAHIVLGSRMKTAIRGGMPPYKFVANRILTALENLSLGLNLSEYHCGYRAFSREFLEKVDFESLSNGFIFDQQIIFRGKMRGFEPVEVPVRTIYSEESSHLSFWNSVKYGLEVITLILRYSLAKIGKRYRE